MKFDKLNHHYSKEDDILSINLGLDVDYSEEVTSLRGHFFVIDYDKKGRIVGIEIFGWNKGAKK